MDKLNRDIDKPGKFPFLRGVHKDMYRSKLWTMRQYAGFGTATKTNERLKCLLARGNTGLSIAFDLPTQMGYDSDDPMAFGEVGRAGVAIDSLEDMELLFDGLPLDKISTSMTINATAVILFSMYLALAKKKSIPFTMLTGTTQNDILKEYVARGTYIFPPGASMRLVVDLIEYGMKYVPRWNTISISGYHMREAGCTAAQEVAFAIANGLEYVRVVHEHGLDINKFGERLSFFFAAHNDFIEEIAKFRAARRLWAHLMRERYNVSNRACALRFHVQTAGSTLTAQQPHNNLTRVTIQALAAVLGGTQSLHTSAFDEALALPTKESARFALSIQQIIALESGVTNTVDPCGGAYAIEETTARIESEILTYIRKIERMGGVLAAIENGFMQEETAKSAYVYLKAIEAKKQIVVGVNKYVDGENKQLFKNLYKHDCRVESNQVKRLECLRSKRDRKTVKIALDNLQTTARSTENIVAPTIAAVKAHATVGEITYIFKEVFGTHKESFFY